MPVTSVRRPHAYTPQVAISGDTLVVGAHKEDSNQRTITHGGAASDNNDAVRAGAAYVYVRVDTTWAQQAYLKASNADLLVYFGYAVRQQSRRAAAPNCAC